MDNLSELGLTHFVEVTGFWRKCDGSDALVTRLSRERGDKSHALTIQVLKLVAEAGLPSRYCPYPAAGWDG